MGSGTSMSVHHLATIYFSEQTTRQLLRIKKDSELLYTLLSSDQRVNCNSSTGKATS